MRSRKARKMGRAGIGASVLALAALIASSGAWAQAGGRLSAECRRPLVERCAGVAEDKRRGCFRQVIQTLPDTCRKAVSDAQAGRAALPMRGMRELSFGSDPRQRVDYALPAANGGRAPLLLFVHGGGWSIGDKRHRVAPKAAHFTASGWAFASTNYRLVPDARVEDQAADVAAAIALLRRQPGIDPDRIVIMGHSAGAHLVALLGTDLSYLEKAGVPARAVRGVIALDGAGYDIPDQIDSPRNLVRPMYVNAFGRDPVRQRRLSPTHQAVAPNLADWLILPVAARDDSARQSAELGAALRKAGARVEVTPIAGRTHMTLNRDLGTAGDPATAVVDAFLKRL